MQFILFKGIIIAEDFFLPRNFRIMRFFVDILLIFRLPQIPDREHEQAVFFENPFHFFKRFHAEVFCREMMEYGDAPDRIEGMRGEGKFRDFSKAKSGMRIFLFRNAEHGAIIVHADIFHWFIFEEVRESTVAAAHVERSETLFINKAFFDFFQKIDKFRPRPVAGRVKLMRYRAVRTLYFL